MTTTARAERKPVLLPTQSVTRAAIGSAIDPFPCFRLTSLPGLLFVICASAENPTAA
jgi:hypothetical protein